MVCAKYVGISTFELLQGGKEEVDNIPVGRNGWGGIG
jgi:hypothetical protein